MPTRHAVATATSHIRRAGRWDDLAGLREQSPMFDAVIDEIDGRDIRVGTDWLTDFASCNYLGFDLDPQIMAAIPEQVARWGTHPSWSRLLGNPRLYPEIEERLTALLGAEDTLVLPTITHIHMSMITVLIGQGSVFVEHTAHKTVYDGCVHARGQGATVYHFDAEDPDQLVDQLQASPEGVGRLVCVDGVNSMTGNLPCAEPARRDLPGQRRAVVRRRRPRVRRDRRTQSRGDVVVRGAGQQRRPALRGDVRQPDPGGRLLQGVLVTARLRGAADLAEEPHEGRRAAVPLLRAVADRLARHGARRLRRERTARRTDPRPAPPAHRPGTDACAAAGHRHAEHLRHSGYRTAAGAGCGSPEGRRIAVAPGHLRHARRVPAGPTRPGRVPDADHGGAHRRTDRPASADHRHARRRGRAAPRTRELNR